MTDTGQVSEPQAHRPLIHFDFYGHGPIKQIIHKAAVLTGYRPSEILGDCRQRPLVYTRFGIVWAARQQSSAITAIARAMDRDHTSIIYAERRAKHLIESNPEFARYCAELAA